MCTVKRAFHRLAERSLLRVLHNHRRPGNRLERDPLKTKRETEREDGSEARNSSKHASRLTTQSGIGKSQSVQTKTLRLVRRRVSQVNLCLTIRI